MSSSPKVLARARHTITALGEPQEEVDAFLLHLRRVDPAHGIRAAPLQEGEAHMRFLDPDKVERWRSLASQIPTPPPFSAMPLGDFLSAAAITFRLAEPHRPWHEASELVSRKLAPRVVQSAIMKTAYMASEGDLGMFLQVIARGSNSVSNFGSIHCDKVGPRAWIMRHEDWYSFYPQYAGTAGFIRGLVDYFGHTGEVELLMVGPNTFEFHIAWS